MTAAAAAALQQAVWEALRSDPSLVGLLGGERVFDAVPAGTPFPYVTFGRQSQFDWSTSTEDGAEHLFSLHVWSKARGRKEVQRIGNAVAARLTVPLSLDGHHLVSLRLEASETRLEEELGVQRATLRFRAVTEPL